LLARIIYPLCKFVIPAVLLVTAAARLLSGIDYPGLRNLPGSEFIGTVLQTQGIVIIVLVILGIIPGLCRFRSCPLAEWFGRGK
jgi:NSS family neurotransmitter:Na+ symporter